MRAPLGSNMVPSTNARNFSVSCRSIFCWICWEGTDIKFGEIIRLGIHYKSILCVHVNSLLAEVYCSRVGCSKDAVALEWAVGITTGYLRNNFHSYSILLSASFGLKA